MIFNTISKIFNYYEKNKKFNQLEKLKEELGELLFEVESSLNNNKLSDNLLSELVDVHIMVVQNLKRYSEEEYLDMMKYKIDRQLQRVSEEIHQ